MDEDPMIDVQLYTEEELELLVNVYAKKYLFRMQDTLLCFKEHRGFTSSFEWLQHQCMRIFQDMPYREIRRQLYGYTLEELPLHLNSPIVHWRLAIGR